MSPIPEPILPTVKIPWQTDAGDAYDRTPRGDPFTAYARYVLDTGSSALNIGLQFGQAGLFFGFGRLGINPFPFSHPTLAAAVMTEFVWGTLLFAVFFLITDPEDYWTEENAIWGFHGVKQTGKPATAEAKEQALISSNMNVFEHMRIGSMA